MQKLIAVLALWIASTTFADLGRAQPVTGGPTTGGAATESDPSRGNATGGGPTGGNVTGGNVTGGNVGVNLGEERRYIVEFSNFIVLDETGCDLCGSDETRFIIRTADYALLSSEYSNLDSSYVPFAGDLSPIPHRFKRCAQPAVDGDSDYDHEWECDQAGKAPPFSFTVAAYEDDGDYPFTGFCAENLANAPNPQGPDIWHPDTGFCVEDRGELIGKRSVELKLDDLSELTAPGQSLVREIDLGGGCDFTQVSACDDSAPHYRLRYVVKRVPDAAAGLPVNPNP